MAGLCVLGTLPSGVLAFSVSSFFNFTGTTTEVLKEEENLQSLKVFEVFNPLVQDKLSTFSDVSLSKLVDSEEKVSFEVGDNANIESTDEQSYLDNAAYTVKKGDTLKSVADYFEVTVETIVDYNHLKSNVVSAGDILEIPSTSGILYKIKKGDTLSSIARKYDIDADDVSLYNGLVSNNDLGINDEVFLPGAKGLQKVPPTKKDIKKDSKKGSTKSLASNLNALANPGQKYVRGDTSHLNTKGSILKYSSLPKLSGYFINPAPGTARTQKMHGNNGVDLAGKSGSPILAAAEGEVRVAKNGGYNFGYGNYIIIVHPNGTETIYGHLLQANVAVGQKVSRGQQIGLLGSSGNSTGPHIHFEIHGAYNPFAW